MPLELGPPVGWPLKYRVTGPDSSKVREIAMQVANLVAGNPHAPQINLSAGEPQKNVQVQVRQTEARALGLSSEDIASSLAALFAGAPVTSLRDGKRMVDVVARAKVGERTDLSTLSNLQLRGCLKKPRRVGREAQWRAVWKAPESTFTLSLGERAG